MKQECTIVGISNAEFSETDGKFNGTETLTKHVYFVNDQSIELAKKAFIMRFLKRIPLDQLEKLVDFKAEDVEIEGQYKEASKFSAELSIGALPTFEISGKGLTECVSRTVNRKSL